MPQGTDSIFHTRLPAAHKNNHTVAYVTTFDSRGYVYSQHFTQTANLALAIEFQLPRYTVKVFLWSHTHHKIAEDIPSSRMGYKQTEQQ